MLGELLKGFPDFGVVRRAIFFSNAVPKVVPNFETKLGNFTKRGQKRKQPCQDSDTPESNDALKCLSSNLITLFPDSKKGETELWRELPESSVEENGHSLGAVCRLCSKTLHVNSSRISEVVVYDETKGTFLASKIPKVCTSKKCHFTQHYGYYTVGSSKFFDEDWKKNEFFLSSSKTAFNMDFLKKLETEIHLGKLSFKDKAEIYNDVHGYLFNASERKPSVSNDGSWYVVINIYIFFMITAGSCMSY